MNVAVELVEKPGVGLDEPTLQQSFSLFAAIVCR